MGFIIFGDQFRESPLLKRSSIGGFCTTAFSVITYYAISTSFLILLINRIDIYLVSYISEKIISLPYKDIVNSGLSFTISLFLIGGISNSIYNKFYLYIKKKYTEIVMIELDKNAKTWILVVSCISLLIVSWNINKNLERVFFICVLILGKFIWLDGGIISILKSFVMSIRTNLKNMNESKVFMLLISYWIIVIFLLNPSKKFYREINILAIVGGFSLGMIIYVIKNQLFAHH